MGHAVDTCGTKGMGRMNTINDNHYACYNCGSQPCVSTAGTCYSCWGSQHLTGAVAAKMTGYCYKYRCIRSSVGFCSSTPCHLLGATYADGGNATIADDGRIPKYFGTDAGQ